MDETLRTLALEYGTFSRPQAFAVGYDDRAIARMIRREEWIRVRCGAYAPTDYQ